MKYSKFFIVLLFIFFIPKVSWATSLSVTPTSGTFFVGSTFDVSLLLDTKGKSINALTVSLSFPPDKLQVISPSLGQSIVGVWTIPPKFNNNNGTVNLEGG